MPEVLEHGAVDAALAERRLGWTREADTLVKTVVCADFAGALAYVNLVGAAAESANHHPDIDIRWNTVRMTLSTHSAGGITDADLELGAVIDGLEPAG
jgi:4a-hydroxytetrahydrobiopterin dehydratase